MSTRPIVLSALLIVPLLAGCTATLATLRIVKANKAIAAAEDEGAAALAVYELELATSYRDKAVEQFADSRHGSAMDLADLARTTARLAQERATGRPAVVTAAESESLEAIPRSPAADPEPSEEPETEDTDPLVEALQAPEEDEAPWEFDDDAEAP